MKKLITGILIALAIFTFGITTIASSLPDKLIIHYYRYDDDYTNFNFWLWPNQPKAGEGKQFNFDPALKNEYGVYVEVDLIENYPSFPETSRMGIIVKQGGWEGYREPGGDRFIDLDRAEVINGTAYIYIVEGDLKIGTSQADLNNHTPDYRAKILRSYFDLNQRIITVVSEIPLNFEVYESSTLIYEGVPTNRTITTSVPEIDLKKTYRVVATYPDNRRVERTVSLENLYDTQMFADAFTYNGTLGVTLSSNQTIFRLWAPLSQNVTLNLYHQGHPLYNDLGVSSEEKTPYATHELTAIESGAWEVILDENLHETYYTYSVTNDGITYEVTDPYAYSTGADGIRGMIVDFSALNPSNWTYGERPNTISNLTDYIVYELHVRDLTTHSSWTGNDSYRGKFLGLTQSGTRFTGSGVTVTTGLDHIVELGVNAVQLLPIFDFGYVSEVEAFKDPNYARIFNWGYMPYHFNTLEGSYATNPFDGGIRIHEFKQVVQAFHDHNIRVIMDVVYNHTGESDTSNFHKIIPGYYHRLTSQGGFSNGSGTGNETASERSMMRKFMIDSVLFWANEYNLSGFRFDLMALHDVETMNIIKEKLHEIDPTIVVYGEPWMGGTSPLDPKVRADKENLKDLQNVGAFNDYTRDAVKGSVWTSTEGAFIQGRVNPTIYQGIQYGIVGGIEFPGITQTTTFANTPDQTINYVSAHDNNTLYDKLRLTRVSDAIIKDLQIQANAIVLTAQGIPFIHAGAEMMRSKPIPGGGFDHNSYESPDIVNQLRWDRKAQYNDVFEYYKALIEIRKTYDHFRIADPNEIRSRLSFLDTDSGDQAVAFRIAGHQGSPDIIVMHSANPRTGLSLVNLGENKYYRMLTGAAGPMLNQFELVYGTGFALAHSTVILVEYQGPIVNMQQTEFRIEKGGSFNYQNQMEPIITGATHNLSNYHDTQTPGRYTVTISSMVNGYHAHTFFTLYVEGYKYNVRLVDKKGGGAHA